MELSTKDNGKATPDTAMGYKSGPMEQNTKDNGNSAKQLVKVNLPM